MTTLTVTVLPTIPCTAGGLILRGHSLPILPQGGITVLGLTVWARVGVAKSGAARSSSIASWIMVFEEVIYLFIRRWLEHVI
jgi:hypothetical protein